MNEEKEEVKYWNPLPDDFYLNENFAEDFKKILINFGIIGTSVETEDK